MVEKIIASVRCGNFWNCVMARIRITGYIQNRKVYSDYAREKKTKKLKSIFKKEIYEGVDNCKPREKGNTIWIYWGQGIENAPDIVKICVNSIINAANKTDYEVVLLTEKNVSQYIQIPEYINQKYKTGAISIAHYSDILRTALLCKYGGGWVDATVLCTAEKIPEYMVQSKLFVFQDINWSDLDTQWSILSSWLIFSESNHPILLMTKKLLYAYWEKEKYSMDYFMYHMFFTLATERYPHEWKKVPIYSNEPPRILQFEMDDTFSEKRWNQIMQMTGIHKLTWKKECIVKESMYEHIVTNFSGRELDGVK